MMPDVAEEMVMVVNRLMVVYWPVEKPLLSVTASVLVATTEKT
jgi:hypothetical protein